VDEAVVKLQRIHELWAELKRTKEKTPEHETLLKKIRILSAEYQALTAGAKNGPKAKMSHYPEKHGSIRRA
jgi:hypothetical protein